MADLNALGVDHMTVDERLSLITAIWNTIAVEDQPPLISDDLRKMLEQRLAHHAANPGDAVPWEEAFARAMARCQK